MGGGDNESCQMGFQRCAEMMLNCPSSGINTRPLSEKIEPVSMSSAYGSSWDPIVSLSQSASFGGVSSIASHGDLTKSSSYPMLLETQAMSSSSHLVNSPLDHNLAMMPKLPGFGGGNFSEIAHTYGLSGGFQNPNVLFPQNYTLNKSGTDEELSINAVQGEREGPIPEGRSVGFSTDGKRKRESDPSCPPNKDLEAECQKDHSTENSGAKEQEDKNQKNEQNATANSSGKQADKQVKDDSQSEEAPKQNYIHVRARRGQATNSHSLAERVRREKISERMRLLQELVPGCNKITGKAVMLDEIINYVQSLQQQVEFLSMKLATVNPELNFDLERLLSKDILHPRLSAATPILGFDPGMSSSHGFSHGFPQGSLGSLPNPASQYQRMSQAVWDNDLQNLLHMGFDPNPSVSSLVPNGNSKNEL